MNENKELMLMLQQISGKLDSIDGKVEQIHKDAKKAGFIAGSVAGAVSGGVVATGIELIKAQLGFS